MPNKVNVLIEYPSIDMMPKVPSSTTGTAIVGIIVARQFCRNRNITRKTSTIASIRVCTTCSTERRTNGVVSYGKATLTSAGKPLAIVCTRSEEHTSELQSLMRNSYAVFCLKKTQSNTQH